VNIGAAKAQSLIGGARSRRRRGDASPCQQKCPRQHEGRARGARHAGDPLFAKRRTRPLLDLGERIRERSRAWLPSWTTCERAFRTRTDDRSRRRKHP
jgi:hypothetical protein